MLRTCILLFVLLFPVALVRAAATTRDRRLIDSSSSLARACVQAVPDRAWINVGAESRAASAREAQRRNTELMTPILDKLRAAGMPADAIRTIGYDLQYEWDFVNNRRVGRGYVARNTVEIRVDNVDRVGELLEMAVGSGATSLGGVRFDLKDRDAARTRSAAAGGRGCARQGRSGGRRRRPRGRSHRADRGAGRAPLQPRPMFRAGRRCGADAAPPISAGQIEIRATVDADRDAEQVALPETMVGRLRQGAARCSRAAIRCCAT